MPAFIGKSSLSMISPMSSPRALRSSISIVGFTSYLLEVDISTLRFMVSCFWCMFRGFRG